MVKKIKLDFSKVEERSNINTRQIPEGIYKMKIDSVQETEAKDGTDMLVYVLIPVDSRYKSRRFPFYCKLQQNQLWKLRDIMVAAGETVPTRAVSVDPGKIVGKMIAAEVEDDSFEGNPRSSVNGTYPLDILDEDGSEDAPADEDEDDEEYEEDEEEAEDLDSLSIAELRKRAKELGIATAKKSKDDLIDEIIDAEADQAEEDDEDEEDEDYDDEDELDEDDLDDEELEDDEEEDEEPAPKRRAPAKKAPAKAAAKAPAKRTVQRRR